MKVEFKGRIVTDYSKNDNPMLMIETLDKDGKTFYVHAYLKNHNIDDMDLSEGSKVFISGLYGCAMTFNVEVEYIEVI